EDRARLEVDPEGHGEPDGEVGDRHRQRARQHVGEGPLGAGAQLQPRTIGHIASFRSKYRPRATEKLIDPGARTGDPGGGDHVSTPRGQPGRRAKARRWAEGGWPNVSRNAW